jgi:uncharacterized membrane protein YfcA
MITATLLATAFGLVVGLALGLTGGGGSVFAMPMLIYGLDMAPTAAVPISLVAVGMTAIVGGIQAIRARLVVWQPTVMFAGGGIVGAPFGLVTARLIPSEWIASGFAALALVVGITMWLHARANPEQARIVRAEPEGGDSGPICVLAPDGQLRYSTPCAIVLACVGLGTGFLSGLFGVGGGFLIVPALIFVTRMGMHRAVATSLLIISAVGLSGAATALVHGSIDWRILAPFIVGGAVAMMAGRRLAHRLAGPALQSGFAVLIILVAIAMLLESFSGGTS